VMKRASSLARKAEARAMSQASPSHFIGTRSARAFQTSSICSGEAPQLLCAEARAIGVSISPGSTAFTRTCRAAYSAAVTRVIWFIAAFEE